MEKFRVNTDELIKIIKTQLEDEYSSRNPMPTANSRELIDSYLFLKEKEKDENDSVIIKYSYPRIFNNKNGTSIVEYSYVIYMVKIVNKEKNPNETNYWIVPYSPNTKYYIEEYFPDQVLIEEYEKKFLF